MSETTPTQQVTDWLNAFDSALASGDVTKEMDDNALGEIVPFDFAVEHELAQLWRQAPMSADYALYKALVTEVVEAARVAVALTGAIHEGEVSRFSGLQEAPFYGRGERLRMSDANEPAHANGSAILDEPNRLVD